MEHTPMVGTSKPSARPSGRDEGAGQTDLDSVSCFLSAIFSGQEQGLLVLFCKPSNVSDFIQFANEDWKEEAAAKALHLREHSNVYFAVGPQGTRPGRGRGKAAGVISLPGLWADID